jgi:toxin ParE1/3/4
MPRLLIRPLAEQDLDDIWDYIAISNSDQAEKVLRHLYAKMGILSHNPHLGKERKEIEVGLRSFAVRSHIIFYYPLSDGIEVVRVLHGARDFQDIFES